jgi:hypothetical protein
VPHGIYFEGQAELLTDRKEQEQILSLFVSRLGADESVIDEAQQDNGHKFYKVVVNNWYAFGSFGRKEVDKHKLVWNGGQK